MKAIICLATVMINAGLLTSAAEVDFAKDIKPIFEKSCIECHGPDKQKAKLRLDSREAALKGGKDGAVIVPKDAARSDLYRRITLPKDAEDVMPSKGDLLTPEQTDLIRDWINQGAVWPESSAVKQAVAEAPAEAPAPVKHEASLAPELPKDFKPTAEEEKAIAKLAATGLAVRPLAMSVPWREADFGLQGTNVTDAAIAPLKDVTSLVEVNLARTKITDAGLESIGSLPFLQRLHLELTAVSDAGLEKLKGLAQLVYLNLYGTAVTDAGLEHLKGMKYLRNLYLFETKVTPAGVATLKKDLPTLSISTGWELNAPVKEAAKKAAGQTESAAESSGRVEARIVQSAQAFLNTLSEDQRSHVLFAFSDKEQRARWSNLPTTMVPRRGLRMGDLTADQRKAAMDLLAATLSKMGYEKVLGIVEADEALKRSSRPGGPAFGRDEFYLSFLGKPSEKIPWMLQFGGHHLALNVTVVGQEDILTPSLIAVQPARYTFEGREVRPLGRETDKAFELVNGLDDQQRKQAVLGFQMRDLVLGPGHDGEVIQPEGLKASLMNEQQQQLLIQLVNEWAGIIQDTAAAKKIAEIKSHLADTWFAWSGPTTPGSAAYFRVQGPTVFIEFAPQKLGGDPTQHIHTMYRDFTNDYGKKLLSQ